MKKGTIQPDHMPLNKGRLMILGMPELTLVESSDIEEALTRVVLPDRTAVSGGVKDPVEFDIKIPMHHSVEVAAMEIWYRLNHDPIQGGAKLDGTMMFPSLSDAALKTYSMVGLWPPKRGIPGTAASNEGEMAVLTWGLSADDVLPV